MRQTHFSHRLVEYIPEVIEDGVLYVSEKYGTAVHKCACGCGEEVVTPLNPTDWQVRLDTHGPTLYPSVGNWSYRCQSHYIIRNGRVVWGSKWSQAQIERERERDFIAKQTYFGGKNRRKLKAGWNLWRNVKSAAQRWIDKLLK